MFGGGGLPNTGAMGGGGKGGAISQVLQGTGGGGSFGGSGDIWDIPQAPAPTADWYSNLSPDIMTGLQQPYIEAQQQGLELLGAGGAAGSARGGASGTAGAMTGEIMGQMAQNVPMQAWQMTQPGAMAQWGQEVERSRYPMTAAVSMLGGTMPEAVVDPGGGGFGGAMTGALGGGAMGGMLGLSNPYTAGMMGLGALMGGK